MWSSLIAPSKTYHASLESLSLAHYRVTTLCPLYWDATAHAHIRTELFVERGGKQVLAHCLQFPYSGALAAEMQVATSNG